MARAVKTPRAAAAGSTADASAPKADKDELLGFYRDMLLIRRFEERAGQLYGMGLIGGFCHLYIGQEAIAVGMERIKEDGDQVITAYRAHGHMLACGIDPRAIMAELTGRGAGVSKGKGGSMHMFAPDQGFYGGHGIVGAQVSLGTGLALANKYKNNKKVAFTYFGDGAANQGQVYESFNMATIWALPVVYVVENNQYAMGTSIERSSSETHLYKRGVSFNIPGVEVDGMDVMAVQEAGAMAAEHARSGKGPFILEMKTYRYRGHSMSDPQKYRTRDEIDEVRKTRDPIDHLQERLEREGVADDTALKAIDAEVKRIVADAAEFARTAPEPDPAELYTDVYAEAAAQ
ncbi:MAG TPA: pyruvate dehydrogenase (acetyl-transferring) E1 component subunit alpha [Caulobacteraceae bacterium]|jgi:pyruvate dehydrogenase E1 component alpha subunit|nr:pyruvate dehydrogenase (acetyl-transferring) E1 component subunit alpha [Caulobacteraceae bacterium]